MVTFLETLFYCKAQVFKVLNETFSMIFKHRVTMRRSRIVVASVEEEEPQERRRNVIWQHFFKLLPLKHFKAKVQPSSLPFEVRKPSNFTLLTGVLSKAGDSFDFTSRALM